jgi:hypothetical protein
LMSILNSTRNYAEPFLDRTEIKRILLQILLFCPIS